MPRHIPTVTVGGTPIPASWSGDKLAALAGITITWGRSSVYDQTGPTTARVQIIDPTGTWASDPSRYGEQLAITIDTGRALFRGWVDELTVKQRRVQNPDGSGPVQVWLATLDATDRLGAFAKAAPPAPSTRTVTPNREYFESRYGAGFWDDAYVIHTDPAFGRINAVRTAAESIGLTSTIADPPVRSLADKTWWMLHQAAGTSLYDLIAQCYILAAAHVNYNAATDTLEPGYLAPATGEKLTFDGTTVRLTVDGAGVSIDASQIVIDRDAETKSTIAQNIAALRLTTAQYTPSNDQIQVNGTTYWIPSEPAAIGVEVPVASTPTSPLAAHNVYQPPFGAQTMNPANSADAYPRAETYVQTVWQDTIRSINGRLTAPPATFDLERFDYGPDAEAILLDTIDHPAALHFPNAKYATLTGFGPAFQLIGGTLTYDTGWKLTNATLAPAAATASTLTLADLSQNDTAALGMCDDPITVGSIGYLTKGLTA